MAVSCICGSFGKPAAEHENDCPVRREWERRPAETWAEGSRQQGERVEPCAVCGLAYGHNPGCIAALAQVAPLTAEQLGCSCGLSSSKPAYRHDRGCPVYRAWVGKERPMDENRRAGARLMAERVEFASVSPPERGEPPKSECPVCHLWVTSLEAHAAFCMKRDRREASGPAFAVGQACVTRDGRKARVICVDAAEPFPVVALVPVADMPNGPLVREWACQYRANGMHTDEGWNDLDLLPAPRRAVVWVRGRWGNDGKLDCWLDEKRIGRSYEALHGTATFEVRVEVEDERWDDE